MKKSFLLFFVLVAAAQWLVPASMIYKKEKTIQKGHVFLFKAEPVDPTDPFMGKYITLYFEARNYEQKPGEDVNTEFAYASLRKNIDGFAEIVALSSTEPANTQDYVKVRTRSFLDFEKSVRGRRRSNIDFPFGRFYMDEYKAQEAEGLYRRSARDTASATYGVVHVYNGDATITDVRIDDKSIVDLVKAMPEKEETNIH
jgi:uncharacterized membrane-anchored protein